MYLQKIPTSIIKITTQKEKRNKQQPRTRKFYGSCLLQVGSITMMDPLALEMAKTLIFKARLGSAREGSGSARLSSARLGKILKNKLEFFTPKISKIS